jgi:acyl-CoA reductase-like NAD-dependent aldehyde dehydrogenase
MRTDLLAGGEWSTGVGPTVAVTDPATAEPLGEVRAADADQTDSAVGAAFSAWPAWRDTPQPERTAALHRVAAEVRARREDLADLVTRETGRARTRNLLYVDWTADIFDMYAELARVHGGRVAPSDALEQLTMVRRVPYGVVAALVTWNYPLLLLAFKVAPAVAVGNTVVVKPAPETTLTTLLLAEAFAEALPPGVVNVIAGEAEVGDRLVRHPDTHLVAFTGSTSVGRRIGATCGEMSKPTHLEMSGKDPAIVFDDVDVALAVEGVVWASFLNAGQVCTSTERCYVHRSLYDAFVERATELAADLRVGDPFDEKTQIGPVRSEAALDRVARHLQDATARGARITTGGDRMDRSGYFLEPAVVADVDHDMELMREETFGPILPIMPFDDDDEALALAADTPYGLGASAYTNDPSRVRRVYDELAVGDVWINDPVVDNLAAPLGGMRGSGNARELGLEGLWSFTTTRHVHWNLTLERKPWWFAPGSS